MPQPNITKTFFRAFLVFLGLLLLSWLVNFLFNRNNDPWQGFAIGFYLIPALVATVIAAMIVTQFKDRPKKTIKK